MRYLRTLFGIILLAAAAFSFYQAYHYWKGYQDSIDYYKKEEKEVVKEAKDDWLKLNWKKLEKQGIVGWISACHRGISYPICYKKDDNEFFVHRNPDGEYSFPGSIFINGYNHPDLSDKNTVIYGHNMRNGTMFRKLHKYEDDSYYKDHPFFYIYTKDGRYKYKIYQRHSVQDGADIYYTVFNDDKEFSDWLKKWGNSADAKYKTQAKVRDRIVTLSTCTQNGKKRLLIQGYLIEFESYDHETVKDRKELGYTYKELYPEENTEESTEENTETKKSEEDSTLSPEETPTEDENGIVFYDEK